MSETPSVRENLLEQLAGPQRIAMAHLGRYQEASEGTLWLEGLNFPRVTMKALERRGLVVRGQWLNEDDGYLWALRGVVGEPADAPPKEATHGA